MKSRLALTLMLVAGLMMTGTGATLAVTGASGDGSASIAQYEEEDTGDRLGDTRSGGDDSPAPGGDDSPAPVGDRVNAADQTEAASAGADSLPFTGFAVIPLLIAGVALALTGGILRLRLRGQDSA